MTPKEKAIELVDKMLVNSCTPHPDDYEGDLYKVHYQKSKQCALIAVFEILDTIYDSELRCLWQEVKEEIEKL